MSRSIAAVLALLAAGLSAKAQESYLPHYEIQKVLAARAEIVPLGVDALGDNVDPNSGNLSFRHVDVELPGIGPLISVARSFNPLTRMPVNWLHMEAFADWTLEIPHVRTEMKYDYRAHGTWPNMRGGWTPANRCSNVTPPISALWQGIDLHIPGRSVQKLLKRDIANQNIPTANASGALAGYPLVTNEGWVVACLPKIRNEEGTEGFLIIDPNGTKYSFDWMVSDSPRLKRLYAPGLKEGPVETWQMMDSYLYVTRIEDRFGNHIVYSYSGKKLVSIAGSDGREVRFTWGDRVLRNRFPNHKWEYKNSTVTASYIERLDVQPKSGRPRVFAYEYDKYMSGTARTWNWDVFSTYLRKVTLPDASTWEFDLGQFSNSCDKPGDTNFYLEECSRYLTTRSFTLNGTVKGPSGLLGTYTLRSGAAGPTVWMQPVSEKPWPHTGEMYIDEAPLNYVLPVLISKKLSRSGVDYTWTYRYLNDMFDGVEYGDPWDAPIPGYSDIRHVAAMYVTEPDGSVERFVTNNIGAHGTQGRILRRDRFSSWNLAAGPVRTVKTTYALRGGPYPARLGNSMNTEWTVFPRQWERIWPFESEEIVQDGRIFRKRVEEFDRFGRPTRIVRTSEEGR